MITIYKTIDNQLAELTEIENGCYISLIHPTEEELFLISNEYEIDIIDLKSALRMNEVTTYQKEITYTVITINIPLVKRISDKDTYMTIPFTIIYTENLVFTICQEDTFIQYNLACGKFKNIYTFMKYRFVLQILYKHTYLFIEYLQIIEKKSQSVEQNMKGITKNSELLKVYELNKALVYFKTSLISNKEVLENMRSDSSFTNEQETKRLLEDVIAKNRHAIEIASIYQDVIEDMLNMFASMISNNLNMIMKFLAMVTIVLSIPNIVSGFYGMNVNRISVPLASDEHSFTKIVIFAISLALIIAFFLEKKDYFKKD